MAQGSPPPCQEVYAEAFYPSEQDLINNNQAFIDSEGIFNYSVGDIQLLATDSAGDEVYGWPVDLPVPPGEYPIHLYVHSTEHDVPYILGQRPLSEGGDGEQDVDLAGRFYNCQGRPYYQPTVRLELYNPNSVTVDLKTVDNNGNTNDTYFMVYAGAVELQTHNHEYDNKLCRDLVEYKKEDYAPIDPPVNASDHQTYVGNDGSPDEDSQMMIQALQQLEHAQTVPDIKTLFATIVANWKTYQNGKGPVTVTAFDHGKTGRAWIGDSRFDEDQVLTTSPDATWITDTNFFAKLNWPAGLNGSKIVWWGCCTAATGDVDVADNNDPYAKSKNRKKGDKKTITIRVLQQMAQASKAQNLAFYGHTQKASISQRYKSVIIDPKTKKKTIVLYGPYIEVDKFRIWYKCQGNTCSQS